MKGPMICIILLLPAVASQCTGIHNPVERRCGPPPSRLYSLPGYPAVQQIFKNVHYQMVTLYLIGNDGTVGVQSWQLNPGDILTLDTAMRQGYVASSGTGPDKRWLRLGGRCYYYPSSPDTDGCTIYISSF